MNLITFLIAGWFLLFPDADPLLSDKDIMSQSVACKPHPRQMTFQQMEFTAFIHFGVNTFTGKEWGNGFEDPKIFNPVNLDTDQWCEAMRAAGMKMAVISIKHHDGFCLWQTRYTKHSVASSTWKDGKGDVLRDLVKSLEKYDIKLGIYLSPADLYQIENTEGLYGNGSEYSERSIPRKVKNRPFKNTPQFMYIVDDYNEYFMNQLFELLTEYGPVHEVWFDGAHPKRKGGQTYTENQWYDLIRKLVPDAVIAIKGPDVRWCGNEAGKTRNAEWSVIPIVGTPDNWIWPDMMDQDLGSMEKIRKNLSDGGFLHWYPAETNTSIRHGWFWRDESQYVKTTEEILDIWYRSVGGNTVFLLNIPPNREGLFSERDVKVLNEVGGIIKNTFKNNLAKGASIIASSTHGEDYKAGNILDDNPETCWMSPDWTMKAELTVKLPEIRQFNRFVLQEQIRNFSQRITEFAIDIKKNGKWHQVVEETTIGYKRICRIPTVSADQIRIRILDSRVSPTLSNFGLYFEPARVTRPEIKREKR